DTKLRECFVNRTNTLRDEDPGHPSATALNYSSYECLITQTYIDCLLESNYKTCKEAIKERLSVEIGVKIASERETHEGQEERATPIDILVKWCTAGRHQTLLLLRKSRKVYGT
ncbi:hypothetical protein GCK32_017923, partial [Trichostrongylus colubriformis]